MSNKATSKKSVEIKDLSAKKDVQGGRLKGGKSASSKKKKSYL